MKQTVLITGASRGIGAACSEIFAENNYNLILTCKNSLELLTNLKIKLEKAYNTTILHKLCDHSNEESVKSLFEELKYHHMEPDILINNAGISSFSLLQDTSLSEWNNVINNNLTSVFITSKASLPHMINNKFGRIVNISSVWGEVGASMEVAYSTSKSGIIGFTKALSKEVAPSHISVNAITFGCIDTDMNSMLNSREKELLENEIPASRFGTPTEAAQTIFAISTAPEYVTGSIIKCDGGWI